MKKIKFSEIKDFSDLPSYIKESSDKDIKFKTKSEVIREFNNDKWSKIDQVLTDNPEITLAKIDNQMESFSNPLTFTSLIAPKASLRDKKRKLLALRRSLPI